MAGIDVFINPYKRDDVAASCSPLKVFEYLAAGRPVVSVPMPEVSRFAPDLRIAGSYFEFGKAIKALLDLNDEDLTQLQNRLTRLVDGDDWSERFRCTRVVVEREFSR
jgi:glycosyltransferase involved in cell wall biosynthesis